MHLTCTTAPAQEPLSLEEAKTYLRLSTNHEDALVTTLIGAARGYVEGITGRALLTQRWLMELTPPYPRTSPLILPNTGEVEITVPLPPLIRIESVKVAGRLVPHALFKSKVRISSHLFGKDISIDFWAGYGEDPLSLPPALKVAVLMATRCFYEGEVVPQLPLLNPYKILTLG